MSDASLNYVNGVLNLAQVEPGIWRGGQPLDPEGWEFLKAQGVTDVVKLNEDDEGSDEGALQRGMILTRLPVNKLQQALTGPELDNLRRVALMLAPGYFVHCTHGWDRTGLAVGLFRVLKCGWTKHDAWAEMRAHGFHFELLGLTAAFIRLAGSNGDERLHD